MLMVWGKVVSVVIQTVETAVAARDVRIEGWSDPWAAGATCFLNKDKPENLVAAHGRSNRIFHLFFVLMKVGSNVSYPWHQLLGGRVRRITSSKPAWGIYLSVTTLDYLAWGPCSIPVGRRKKDSRLSWNTQQDSTSKKGKQAPRSQTAATTDGQTLWPLSRVK